MPFRPPPGPNRWGGGVNRSIFPNTPRDRMTATIPRCTTNYNDPDGDIVLVSKEKVEFRVRSIDLRAASGTFDSILAMSSTRPASPIVCDESTEELNVFLHFVKHHRFYTPSPLDPNVTPKHFERLVRVLDKYQCDTHLSLAEQQAALLYPDNFDRFTLFKLACKFEWAVLAKIALVDFSKSSYSNPIHNRLEPHRLELGYWSEESIMEIGVKAYRALWIAYHDATSVALAMAETKERIWLRASDRFTFDWHLPPEGVPR